MAFSETKMGKMYANKNKNRFRPSLSVHHEKSRKVAVYATFSSLVATNGNNLTKKLPDRELFFYAFASGSAPEMSSRADRLRSSFDLAYSSDMVPDAWPISSWTVLRSTPAVMRSVLNWCRSW